MTSSLVHCFESAPPVETSTLEGLGVDLGLDVPDAGVPVLSLRAEYRVALTEDEAMLPTILDDREVLRILRVLEHLAVDDYLTPRSDEVVSVTQF
jgi:hypothetical protein